MAHALKVIVHNNIVYASPNSTHFPYDDVPVGPSDPHSLPPHLTQSMQFALSSHPQLAYTPAKLRYEGLFERLNVKYSNLKLQGTPSRCAMETDLMQEWSNLEVLLYETFKTLLGAVRTGQSWGWFPLDMEAYPPPSRFGYMTWHNDPHTARRKIIRSRNAFLPLIGICSMGIAIHSYGSRSSDPTFHPKAQEIMEKANFRAELISQLFDSQVANFEIARAGTVYPANESFWWPQLLCMIKHNVPVWFRWGATNKPVQAGHESFLVYRPTVNQVYNALAESQSTISQVAAPHPNIAHHFPEVQKGSGQLFGENWELYFERKEKQSLVRAAKLRSMEDQNNFHSAMQRKEHAKSFLQPSSAAVYYWEAQDEFNNFRVRTRVPRNAIPGIWEHYQPAHMRFNEFDNEWDVCSEFAPDVDTGIGYDDYEDLEPPPPSSDISVQRFLQETRIREAISAPTLSNPKTACDDEIRRSLASFQKVHPSIDLLDTPDDILRQRYGFTLPPTNSSNIDQASIPSARLEKFFVLKAGSILDDSHTHHHLSLIVNAILSEEHTLQIPGDLYDLNQDHPNTLFTSYPLGRSMFQTMVLVHENKWWYYLMGNDGVGEDGKRWSVATTESLNCVHYIRHLQHKNQIADAWNAEKFVDFLVQRGMSFYIFTHLRPEDQFKKDIRSQYWGLGYRNPQWRGDKWSYLQYIKLLQEFLQEPRARLALAKGGLIWRLCIFALNFDLALLGPSLQSGTHGIKLELDVAGPILADDLSEEELNLICGVYKVYTAQKGQTEDASWWPKHYVWAKSGLNVGYWSTQCEEWFMNRVRAILEGREHVKNAKNWNRDTSFFRQTRSIVAYLTKEAHLYIA